MSRARAFAITAALFSALAIPARAQGPDLDWYGYVKLDASWDEAVVSAGNFARWVVSAESEDPHAHFNMTSRQTRVGFRLSGERGSARVTGLVEMDFYGGGAENKNSLQVRHAYVRLVWPSGWELLAGQAPDVISPLVPTTLNYTVAWWAGNIGYRRPQLRISRIVPLNHARLRFDVAAVRTIGDDFGVSEPGDTGSDSGRPTVAGRVEFSVPSGGGRITLGTSVHRGDENLRDELGGDNLSLATSSWGVDLAVDLGRIVVRGEVWGGANLDDQFGGIGQGLRQDVTTASAIASTGGWGEVVWKGRGATLIGIGGGVDDPDDADLALGFRARNAVGWMTGVRDLGDGLRVGLEVSRWETLYVGLAEGSSYRVQGSVIYVF